MLEYNRLSEQLRVRIQEIHETQDPTVIKSDWEHAQAFLGLWAETYRGGPIVQSVQQPQSNMKTFSLPWFVFGCVFTAVAIVFAVWGFAIGDLTDDRRLLLKWILPIASGIAFGAMTGAISVQTRDIIPFTAVSAGGGAAVWLLTTFVLFPAAPSGAFNVTVYTRDNAGALLEVDGQIVIELNRLSPWPLNKGQSLPQDIAPRWKNKSVKIKCTVAGYKQALAPQVFKLIPGNSIDIVMLPEKVVSVAEPPVMDLAADWQADNWKTARINITWVFGDEGAHTKYIHNLGSGKFSALLEAQKGNTGAYESISAYGPDRTARFLQSIGQ